MMDVRKFIETKLREEFERFGESVEFVLIGSRSNDDIRDEKGNVDDGFRITIVTAHLNFERTEKYDYKYQEYFITNDNLASEEYDFKVTFVNGDASIYDIENMNNVVKQIKRKVVDVEEQ